jgi:hypothetical protein
MLRIQPFWEILENKTKKADAAARRDRIQPQQLYENQRWFGIFFCDILGLSIRIHHGYWSETKNRGWTAVELVLLSPLEQSRCHNWIYSRAVSGYPSKAKQLISYKSWPAEYVSWEMRCRVQVMATENRMQVVAHTYEMNNLLSGKY